MKRKGNLLFGIILILIFAYIWYDTGLYPEHLLDARKTSGPGTLPRILSAIMGVIGVYELFCWARSRRSGGESGASGFSLSNFGTQNIIIIVLMVIAYVPLIMYFGFAAATVTFSAVLMIRFKAKPLLAVAVSILTVAFIILVFDFVLRVQFPAGILTAPLGWRF